LQRAGEDNRPEHLEVRLVARRQAVTEVVMKHLAAQPLGGIKAETSKWCWYTQMKRVFSEFGRRMRARGLLSGTDDFCFLARYELHERSPDKVNGDS
jgi:hypothetical protein